MPDVIVSRILRLPGYGVYWVRGGRARARRDRSLGADRTLETSGGGRAGKLSSGLCSLPAARLLRELLQQQAAPGWSIASWRSAWRPR
jgi:hypothetical protein